jgi:hypothetical protein
LTDERKIENHKRKIIRKGIIKMPYSENCPFTRPMYKAAKEVMIDRINKLTNDLLTLKSIPKSTGSS